MLANFFFMLLESCSESKNPNSSSSSSVPGVPRVSEALIAVNTPFACRADPLPLQKHTRKESVRAPTRGKGQV